MKMGLKVACRASDLDKHEWDITYLLFAKGKLYSASDDGKIKIWTPDLIKLEEVQAHPCSVYCIAARDDTLYSCSNDGTIKMWALDTLKEKGILAKDEDLEYSRVCCSGGNVISGDNQGAISVYKGTKLYGQINIAEPINDMIVTGDHVFTVRDLYLVITELKLEGEKIQYVAKGSYMGRAPITLIGDKLFAFPTREGMEIQLHQNDPSTSFKQVARMTQGSELIINALAGVKWDEQEQLYSGGWDKILKQWTIKQDCPTNTNSIELDIVINAIVGGEKNQVYVGGSDGHIMRVDVSA